MRSVSVLLALLLTGCGRCPTWLALPSEMLESSGQAQAALMPAGCQAKPGVSRVESEPDFAQLAQADFVAFGGGGAPRYNEIALEKNFLYFQRSLRALQLPSEQATLFFANGDDGRASLRYLNPLGQERFKVPAISGLSGPATKENFERLFQAMATSSERPNFFYFTGHGWLNRENHDNNAMILWEESLVTVQDFAQLLDKLPAAKPTVVMMAQCFSGSFANLIYEGGDPTQPVALQSRCGFFATTKDLPSVGCTPEVDEADYRDYSSSFFAGLTGIDRIGNPVASADYNRDGQVSYAEAHAFAKLDGQTSDRPISTLEAWLQQQIRPDITQFVLDRPFQQWLPIARPERAVVIEQLTQLLDFDAAQSWMGNTQAWQPKDEVEAAYVERLRMELLNVAGERIIQAQPEQKDILERLIDCEGQIPGQATLLQSQVRGGSSAKL